MIIIEKSKRVLRHNGTEYGISLGFSPIGHKKREGDGKTPEGGYYVCTKNSASKFYLSLGISYPNEADAAWAFEEGAITEAQLDEISAACDADRRPAWDTPLGGYIMIHGERPGASGDWTQGCIALKNEDMKQLFDSVEIGEEIEIIP